MTRDHLVWTVALVDGVAITVAFVAAGPDAQALAEVRRTVALGRTDHGAAATAAGPSSTARERS
ncbi:hypothetical protein FKR81_20515 [Lentzea tibetensis]|uniref:Uncharacterized protein n=1 Tax=Lentzea tibetensis TaxID=2591470 RepID=A0A563ESH5_9PSEU|nr:hypothetical protein [Lentzea tibetensis]TWP50552.1 hypothetical protein FKR81_20515 [Lentzea tibetensis]